MRRKTQPAEGRAIRAHEGDFRRKTDEYSDADGFRKDFEELDRKAKRELENRNRLLKSKRKRSKSGEPIDKLRREKVALEEIRAKLKELLKPF